MCYTSAISRFAVANFGLVLVNSRTTFVPIRWKGECRGNEIKPITNRSDSSDHKEHREHHKYDELKTLSQRTEKGLCFDSDKGFSAHLFYVTLKRQLSLISQFKGGMDIKRYLEMHAKMTDDDMEEGIPEHVKANPQLEALYAARVKYAEEKDDLGSFSPTKSSTVTTEAEPGTYTNKTITKEIVVVPEEHPCHPSKWSKDTQYLDGRLFAMVEQYWFKGPLLKRILRECSMASHGHTYTHAIHIALLAMQERELTRKRVAGSMWTNPSLALTFNNPEEFLRKWSERISESNNSGLTLVDIYGLNFLAIFHKEAGDDVAYKAALEEFDQGLTQE